MEREVYLPTHEALIVKEVLGQLMAGNSVEYLMDQVARVDHDLGERLERIVTEEQGEI